MARKGWNALSPTYRKRLEKAGISQADYAAGTSISGARGHLHTPERPSQVNPSKHGGYLQRRDALIQQVVRKKHYYFSTAPKWNQLQAMKPYEDNPPSMAVLKYWAGLSREEWVDAIRTDRATTPFLGYH
jgi:hypothetical protein